MAGGPFSQSGALRRMVAAPLVGDVGCHWFGVWGRLMQKAGEGGEETTEEGARP